MDKERREIRFFVRIGIYNKLKKKAEELDIPLASYIKANIKNWCKKL